MAKKCDKCARCREYEDRLLKTLNSPYDIAIEMMNFRNECERKGKENKDGKYDNET